MALELPKWHKDLEIYENMKTASLLRVMSMIFKGGFILKRMFASM